MAVEGMCDMIHCVMTSHVMKHSMIMSRTSYMIPSTVVEGMCDLNVWQLKVYVCVCLCVCVCDMT